MVKERRSLLLISFKIKKINPWLMSWNNLFYFYFFDYNLLLSIYLFFFCILINQHINAGRHVISSFLKFLHYLLKLFFI